MAKILLPVIDQTIKLGNFSVFEILISRNILSYASSSSNPAPMDFSASRSLKTGEATNVGESYFFSVSFSEISSSAGTAEQNQEMTIERGGSVSAGFDLGFIGGGVGTLFAVRFY